MARDLRRRRLGMKGAAYVQLPWEIETVERLTWLGEEIEWRRVSGDGSPTSDSYWVSRGGIKVEIKRAKANYKTVADNISEAVDGVKEKIAQGADESTLAEKQVFIVDLGRERVRRTLIRQLSQYNARRPERKIEELWLLYNDGETFEKIDQT